MIHHEMTVRDVLKKFPQSRSVFDRYGMHGCGGADGPDEPVAFFAEMHGLTASALLAELRAAIESTPSLQAPAGGCGQSSCATASAAAAASNERSHPANQSCGLHETKDPCPCGPGEMAGDPVDVRISARAAKLLDAPAPRPRQSISGEPAASKCAHGEAGKSIARTFIRTSLLVFLCYGALTGIAAFLSVTTSWAALPASIQWPALVQSHAHAQVFGFVAMFILGISYHVMPRFMGVPLRNIGAAWASYGLLLGGVILRSLYQPFAQYPAAAMTVVLGSLLEVSAVIAFLCVVRSTLREHQQILPAGRSGQSFVHIRYLMAGGAWLLTAAVLGVVGAGAMLVREVNVQPAVLSAVWINLSVFGFAGMFIFGVGQRTMPHFLALDDVKPAVARAALAALTAGLTLQIAYLVPPHLQWINAMSALLELAGFTLFLIAVPLLGRLPASRPAAPPLFASFVRMAFAFGWIGAAGFAGVALADVAGVSVPRTLADSFRHAWTLGWITLLIVGVGYRLIPIFFGRPISMPRAVPVIFALLIGGVVVRISADIVSMWVPGAYPWVNLSGILIMAGMLIFAVEIWRLTAGAEAAEHGVRDSLPITADANVAAVLEAYPQLLPVFVRNGFGALQNPVARKTVARFVTIEQAARKHGINPAEFVNQLKIASSS